MTRSWALLAVFLLSSFNTPSGFAAEKVLYGFSKIRYGTGTPSTKFSAPERLALRLRSDASGWMRLVSFEDQKTALDSCIFPECESLNLKGGVLFPGLHDTHAHQISSGAGIDRVQVSGSSISSIQAAVKTFAEAHPGNPWILGRGWNAAGFGTQFPTAADLDAACADRPVALIDSDGHQVWANTAAIRAAKITADTQDPEGGTILRDPNGNPAGVFLETAADLLWEAIPDSTPEQLERYILSGEQEGLEAGFTSHHGGPVGISTIEAYQRLDEKGQLKQRSYLWADLEASDEDFQKILQIDVKLQKQGRVRVSAFKGFVDGVISSYTGALVEPYADAPQEHGESPYSQEELNARVLRANAAGYPVTLHAIGDRAVRMALDAYEESYKILNHRLVNRIEHIEVVHPLDIPRFSKLNVAAAMQPSHMHFSSENSSYYDERLGLERLHYAFAWGEIARTGALLLFGTDTPVVPQDSVEALHCAVKRSYRNGQAFELQNRVSEDQAVAAFSLNAKLSLESIQGMNSSGPIAVGELADFVIFPKDPFDSQARSLGELQPSLVIIDGQVVLDRTP